MYWSTGLLDITGVLVHNGTREQVPGASVGHCLCLFRMIWVDVCIQIPALRLRVTLDGVVPGKLVFFAGRKI